MRVYAIGDVHGRADLLEQLLLRIDADLKKHGDGAGFRSVGFVAQFTVNVTAGEVTAWFLLSPA